jgi:hypothetical protein
MPSRVSVVVAGIALTACNTTGVTDGPDNSIARPIQLTVEQTDEIHKDLRAYLVDPADGTFGPLHAGQFPNGQVLICGHLQAGVFQRWTPFAAYGAGKKFWMGIRGGGAINICNDRGIVIGATPA